MSFQGHKGIQKLQKYSYVVPLMEYAYIYIHIYIYNMLFYIHHRIFNLLVKKKPLFKIMI